MSTQAPKPPWADEPSPLCDAKQEDPAIAAGFNDWPSFARDLERRLRHARRLVGKLRADSECGDFDEDDLEQRLARIEETLTP